MQRTPRTIMAAIATAAAAFLAVAAFASAITPPEPRLTLSTAVTACDAYEAYAEAQDLLEGEMYRLQVESDPAPFGTWEHLATIDIGDSEEPTLIDASELPANTRYRVTIEVFVGGSWIDATGQGGQYDATAELIYAQAEFCPPEPEPTEEPTPEPTAEPEPTEEPEPTPEPTQPAPTPQVIIVENERETTLIERDTTHVERETIIEREAPVPAGSITPPSTGSAGIR